MEMAFNKRSVSPRTRTDAAAYLRQWGLRVTRPRLAVVAALERTAGHLSADEIRQAVRAGGERAGLTTVYRTLQLLERMQLVVRHEFGDGECRYELADGWYKMHHHHLVCSECGTVTEYRAFEEENALVARMQEVLSRKYRFTIRGHQFNFLGLCARCCDRSARTQI